MHFAYRPERPNISKVGELNVNIIARHLITTFVFAFAKGICFALKISSMLEEKLGNCISIPGFLRYRLHVPRVWDLVHFDGFDPPQFAQTRLELW